MLQYQIKKSIAILNEILEKNRWPKSSNTENVFYKKKPPNDLRKNCCIALLCPHIIMNNNQWTLENFLIKSFSIMYRPIDGGSLYDITSASKFFFLFIIFFLFFFSLPLFCFSLFFFLFTGIWSFIISAICTNRT